MTRCRAHYEAPRLAALLLLVPLCLTACGLIPSAKRVSDENDRLRRENLDLHRERDALKERVAQRVAEIDVIKQQHPGLQTKVEGAEVLVPTRLRFDRYSGALDTNSDKRDDVVRVYLVPEDQHGRFMSVAGVVDLRLMAAPAGAAPIIVAEKHYDPTALGASFHQGFTGVYYSLEVPLPESLPQGVNAVTAQVTFNDAATGARLVQEKSFRLSR